MKIIHSSNLVKALNQVCLFCNPYVTLPPHLDRWRCLRWLYKLARADLASCCLCSRNVFMNDLRPPLAASVPLHSASALSLEILLYTTCGHHTLQAYPHILPAPFHTELFYARPAATIRCKRTPTQCQGLLVSFGFLISFALLCNPTAFLRKRCCCKHALFHQRIVSGSATSNLEMERE